MKDRQTHYVPATPQRYPYDELAASPARWNALTRVAFRFFFCFFVLFCFPSFDNFVLEVGDPLPFLWHRAVPWLALHFFDRRIAVLADIGDSEYNYALSIVFIGAAAMVTILWTTVDRKRTNYEALYRWFRLYIAVCLGVQMIDYGFAKIFPGQMLPPSLSRLSMRAGDMNPASLMWFFMSSARLYQAFGGWVELVGGLLLFMPRLRNLGALVSAAALTNVFVMNVSYNVTVRLFSFQLLVMAVFVCAPDLARLADVLVFGRPVPAAPHERFFWRRWLNLGLLALVAVYGLTAAVRHIPGSILRARKAADISAIVPFYGIWNVDEFVVDGNVHPPLVTDNLRWRQVIFDFFMASTVVANHQGSRSCPCRTRGGCIG
jgi:hypothetical protein